MTGKEVDYMTQSIRAKVAQVRIAVAKRDFEVAHIQEDKILEDFIIFISGRSAESPEFAALAKEILEVRRLHFPRHYA